MKKNVKKTFYLSLIVFTFLLAQPELEKQALCGHSKAQLKLATMQSTLTVEQSKIDVLYYRLNLDIDPRTNTIVGDLTAEVRVIDSTLSRIEFDLINTLTVTGVNLNDITHSYSRNSYQVLIPILDSVAVNQILTISINYNGSPGSTGFGSFAFDSHNGLDLIWTLSEPYGARTWWPCKDDPSDKADSVDIIIKVPSNLTVASNGNLVGTMEQGNEITFYWQERYPITTYLVSLAIYPYQVWYDQYESNSGVTMPIEFYVFPDHYNSLRENYLLTKDMISFFAEVFGEYPFINEKYGHAEFGWGGGMEHQTITSLGSWSESLIAHELAHMWWGDMITCASFHHIWLNEGFATYAEALWWEQYSTAALHADMDRNKYFGGGTIYVENPVTTGDIFNGDLSYRKASWVIHMLRHVVGDSTFFNILRTYADEPSMKYNSVTTDQFRSVCEAVSGLDLQTYFQQWIYGSYFPRYALHWQQNQDSLIVTIQQVQQTGTFFQMPIDLEIICTDTTYTEVVNNTQVTEDFTLALPPGKMVSNVILDPDDWILKSVQYLNNGVDQTLPTDFVLEPAYPNPFNAMVTIPFKSKVRGSINISIFNIRGEEVQKFSGNYDPGNHSIVWDGKDRYLQSLSSGVFIVRMQYSKGSDTRKILLLK
ncbi:MAG: T9SS type A sorting domain-containing protein [Candidatus Marinimicrobia bacterium]|nr:T9SS type A sorting domain-containing protein [Candidatus Neomarinimicrobiota bacterium]